MLFSRWESEFEYFGLVTSFYCVVLWSWHGLRSRLKWTVDCLVLTEKSNFIENLRDKMFRPTLGSIIPEGTKWVCISDYIFICSLHNSVMEWALEMILYPWVLFKCFNGLFCSAHFKLCCLCTEFQLVHHLRLSLVQQGRWRSTAWTLLSLLRSVTNQLAFLRTNMTLLFMLVVWCVHEYVHKHVQNRWF